MTALPDFGRVAGVATFVASARCRARFLPIGKAIVHACYNALRLSSDPSSRCHAGAGFVAQEHSEEVTRFVRIGEQIEVLESRIRGELVSDIP